MLIYYRVSQHSITLVAHGNMNKIPLVIHLAIQNPYEWELFHSYVNDMGIGTP
jgi:hypothetical protein